MAERDYASQPVADALGLRAVIDGLASDLQDLRAGTLTPQQAMAHAAIAKQLFNGVRLYLAAHATLHRPPAQPSAPAIEGHAE